MHRTIAIVAGATGLTGVLAGALGAHQIKRMAEGLVDAADRLRWWETAAKYHLLHALGLAFLALLAAHSPGRAAKVGAWVMGAGVVLFSGSLYVMALLGIRWLGLVTPFGGMALALGWVGATIAAARLPK